MTTKCANCESSNSFFRQNGAYWCRTCGHRKNAAKARGESLPTAADFAAMPKRPIPAGEAA